VVENTHPAVVRQRDVTELRIANDSERGQTTVRTLILTGRFFSKRLGAKLVALFAGLPRLGLKPAAKRSKRSRDAIDAFRYLS
jgi:hypothetical protein